MTSETFDRDRRNVCPRDREFGQIDTRLNAHDERLKVINGSITRTGAALEELTKVLNASIAEDSSRERVAAALEKADERRRADAVQARQDLLDADERRRVQAADDAERTAKALAAADDERTKKAARKFAPISRGITILAAVEGIALTYLTYEQAIGRG